MNDEALDPEATTLELRAASRSLAAAAAKLGALNKEFAGGPGPDGEFVRGAGREYELKVGIRKVGLYNEAIAAGNRPAGEDARHAIAEVEIRQQYPALAADYDRITSERIALKEFISAQKGVIEGHRSVLSAAKVLTGMSS